MRVPHHHAHHLNLGVGVPTVLASLRDNYSASSEATPEAEEEPVDLTLNSRQGKQAETEADNAERFPERIDNDQQWLATRLCADAKEVDYVHVAPDLLHYLHLLWRQIMMIVMVGLTLVSTTNDHNTTLTKSIISPSVWPSFSIFTATVTGSLVVMRKVIN